MSNKIQSRDISALKSSLLDAFISAYMYRNRLHKQNTRIRALIKELREAGVRDNEIISIKLEAFYIANPEERRP